MSPTLNSFDNGDTRAVTLVTGFAQNQRGKVVTSEIAHQLTTGGAKPGEGYSAVMVEPTVVQSLTNLASGGPDDNEAQAGHLDEVSRTGADDPLLPAGLSSNRYRCIGNGVATPVAEWIAWRLADYFGEAEAEEDVA